MTAIVLQNVGKTYRLYAHARDHFWELLTRRPRHRARVALSPLTLSIGHGEVVGVIGVNGAGKSTLLKLMSGTMQPSSGTLTVDGRVCALLELGAGFHPEMTGRENIYLGGAVVGLTTARIDEVVDAIIDFSGLSEAIDQPVKTYSSGMNMRLAFSVATAVDPDILILDETLSVGDGAFAKKSFDRIMGFKEAGKTILFCSHSMYQVQSICNRALWLEGGQLRMDGDPDDVISAYNEFMASKDAPARAIQAEALGKDEVPGIDGHENYRLLKVEVLANGVSGRKFAVRSGQTELVVTTDCRSEPGQPLPNLGVVIIDANGHPVTSTTTLIDGFKPARGPDGVSSIKLTLPAFPLLKGTYWVHVFLLCDRGLHVYDKARMVAELVVTQDHPAIGVVSIPRVWEACTNGPDHLAMQAEYPPEDMHQPE